MKNLFTTILMIAAMAAYSQTSHTVAMMDNFFQPDNITIDQGDTVVWVHQGNATHTTTSGTACTQDGMWNSGSMSNGETFMYVFDTDGSFPYFCIPHCGIQMDGTVEVNPVSTSIADAENIIEAIELYPNPASDEVKLSLQTASTETPGITIYDITGRELPLEVEAAESSAQQQKYALHTNQLPAGVYFVQIEMDEKVMFTEKLVKQ